MVSEAGIQKREILIVTTCGHRTDHMCWDCYKKALATARRDAMEECAAIAEAHRLAQDTGLLSGPVADTRVIHTNGTAMRIASAIRKKMEEENG